MGVKTGIAQVADFVAFVIAFSKRNHLHLTGKLRDYHGYAKLIRVSFHTLRFVFAILSALRCPGQSTQEKAWTLLEAGARQYKTESRVTAVRVLGLLPDNDRATELFPVVSEDDML